MNKKNIILFGIPRSGTTWLAKILIAGGELNSIHEPDNERHTYSAYYYKRGLSRFPYIGAEVGNDDYKKLFFNALNKAFINNGTYSNELLYKLARVDRDKIELDFSNLGHNRIRKYYPEMQLYPLLPKQVKKGKRRVVKSVHAVLSADYIIENLDVNPVVIIRHPAGVVSSHLYLENLDIDRKIYQNHKLMIDIFGSNIPDFSALDTKESLGGFQTAIFYEVIHQLLIKFPNIQLVQYEELATDPEKVSKELYKNLNLSWNSQVSKFLSDTNKIGEGYETNRVASEQINIWKKRLTEKQLEEIRKGYSLFSPEYYRDFVS